jgi:hypothetical protein
MGHPAARPPVLASEALRRDLEPGSPAAGTTRWVAGAMGAIGVVQTLLLAGLHGVAVPVAGAFAALGLLGPLPMGYAARAAATATIAGCGLSVASFAEAASTGRAEPVVLSAGVTLLAAALLFRAWHRASLLARALVALGSAVCAGFLAMSQALQRLPIVDPSWQAWLPQLVQLALVLLLFLSLLAFMDSRSTGGCDTWAVLLLGWYASFRLIELLIWRWPAQGQAVLEKASLAELSALHAAAPLFVGALSLALAQLFATHAARQG